MNFLTLIGIEFRKIRRSGIILILTAATVILWLPSVLNADMNFEMQAEGILPEHNFLIQGFLGMAWFIFPAGMVVSTVLVNMTERTHRGLLKMLSLPVSAAGLCLAKFVVLLALAAIHILITVAAYFVCAGIASKLQNYDFVLPPLFVLKEAGLLFTAAIPMLAVFFSLSVCIRTPIFSVGIGLASIVLSVLIINTKIWFLYPMSYPFFVMTAEYGKLASRLTMPRAELFPWIPAAAAVTVFCLLLSCLCFGHTERS
ncbi:MAG: ABC transporter permease [Butyrivibrio sp.]|nr:ABC transporter permease [Butyrivibrio sp.]